MYFMIYFQIESLNGREFLLIFTCIPNQMDIGTKIKFVNNTYIHTKTNPAKNVCT